ncbi:glycosyltransferase [Flavobacterium faecale]|uniref:glycosyltransferase n=1 Tax=Flavobacterium faecale TaxID=1355330 RepID=UPI003AAD2137
MKQRTIVISGINMVEGGIFTILDNCLQKISSYSENKEIKIIALVNDKSKFNYPNIEYIEFPKSKKSWTLRLYYEYFYFKKFSKKINPDVWLSLHDITPNVVAKKRFVYCHHPTIFFKAKWKDWRFNYKIGVFSILYKYLYQINIRKNDAVFVQQDWIKNEFEKLFDIKNIFVCRPEFTEIITTKKIALEDDKIHFLYPSFPRTFKNFELIFDAIELLDHSTKDKVKFHFTAIKDNPNAYAIHLYQKYNTIEQVVFWGINDRNELLKLYNSVDCIIFPSKLETWGLPISEAKAFEKPMLLANLPYAKETVGDYHKVSFFDIENPKELAQLITLFTNKTIQFQGNLYSFNSNSQLNDWGTLFNYILKD